MIHNILSGQASYYLFGYLISTLQPHTKKVQVDRKSVV